VMGELMFIRSRYGHGGRVGYDQEWPRDPPKLSGGGELMTGHSFELICRLVSRPVPKVEGQPTTYFWNMPVDRQRLFKFANSRGQTAWCMSVAPSGESFLVEI